MSQKNLMDCGDYMLERGCKMEGGPAVYHVALYLMNSGQNVVVLNLGGIITVPPEWRGERKPASKPCTWNNGMTRYDRSD